MRGAGRRRRDHGPGAVGAVARSAAAGAMLVLAMTADATAQFDRLSLSTLALAHFVDVALDTTRFRQDQVATITIVNKLGVPVEGEIPACTTVFEPSDTRLSALAPGESGRFVVGAAETVKITRPFRALDPAKRPPDGSAYRLSAQSLRHDLSRCQAMRNDARGAA